MYEQRMVCAPKRMTDGELQVMTRKTGMSATQHWWKEGDHPLVPETERTAQPRTKVQESLPWRGNSFVQILRQRNRINGIFQGLKDVEI